MSRQFGRGDPKFRGHPESFAKLPVLLSSMGEVLWVSWAADLRCSCYEKGKGTWDRGGDVTKHESPGPDWSLSPDGCRRRVHRPGIRQCWPLRLPNRALRRY